MAQWEDSPNGWRVSFLLEDAPTNLGVLRNANLVENNVEDSSSLPVRDPYKTNCGSAQESNEEAIGQSGQVAPDDLGGRVDGSSNEKRGHRSDNLFRGDDSFCAGRMSCGLADKETVVQSARIVSANQASFDAGAHVVATRAKAPEAEEKPTAYSASELSRWAMANYAVDPVQNSKNRWRIRIRCRKTGCKHEGHLKLKTVSFMSDSVYKKLIRSKRNYELWKKQVLAENAGTLRQGN